MSEKSEYQKRRQAAKRGECRQCSKPAQPGRRLCLEHLLTRKAYCKARRAAAVAAGKCYQLCGKPPVPGHMLCERCADKSSERGARYYQKRKGAGG